MNLPSPEGKITEGKFLFYELQVFFRLLMYLEVQEDELPEDMRIKYLRN